MADRPRTREELYERIRRSSKDSFVLEDMIRLGFWPAQGVLPEDPADEIRRRTELEAQRAALQTELKRLHNEAALRKEAHKRRLEASRLKRAETKERQLKARAEKAAAWKEAQTQDITFLGPEVSAGLNKKQSDEERLHSFNLPILHNASQLAQALGLPLGTLRFLTFTRRLSSATHYRRFYLPKRSGGQRLISAPLPRLKKAQRWILEAILLKLPLHPAAHGFRPGHSIVSNAVPHVGRAVVINLDLKDFFPTVTWKRVRGLFRHMGYSEAVSTLLALLCTEADLKEIQLDGRTWYLATGTRHLPQGSPASPAITNLLCRKLDYCLTERAEARGFTYTRYADDLTFSAPAGAAGRVGALLKAVAPLVAREGFQLHPDKTRVMRRGSRQEVTGIVVNQRPNLDRETLRRFRALLHQLETQGLEGKHWGQGADLLSSIAGYAAYVAMVNPARGEKLQAQVDALLRRHRPPRPPAAPSSPAAPPAGSAAAAQAAPTPTAVPVPTSPPASPPILPESAPTTGQPAATEPAQPGAPEKGHWWKSWWK